nr:ATPase, T2SS/T4P/T4SS family [uncultured Desulfobacter sp.]
MSVVLDSLKHNFGETVIQALEDDNVIEIMLNDDGSLWLDTFDNGMMPVSEINPSAAAGILSQVASMLGTVVTKDQPIVEGELPIDGSRFEGLFPPVVANPTFTIRKKATKIFTLENYVNTGIMAQAQRQLICESITTRKNILVVGGTGSGKTTWAHSHFPG